MWTTVDRSNIGAFNCHSTGTTFEVCTMATEPKSFMSCGEDGTVRLYDLRQISRHALNRYVNHSAFLSFDFLQLHKIVLQRQHFDIIPIGNNVHVYIDSF